MSIGQVAKYRLVVRGHPVRELVLGSSLTDLSAGSSKSRIAPALSIPPIATRVVAEFARFRTASASLQSRRAPGRVSNDLFEGGVSTSMRVAVLAAVLVLTACGSAPALQAHTSPQPSTTATSTPSVTPTPTAAPTPTSTGVKVCAASAVELSLVGTDGAAGHIFANLALTNSSSAPCTLDGFPTAQLFSASGASVATRVVDRGGELASSPKPSKFVLAPTQRASSTVSWGDVNVGTEICKRATTIEIGLPGSAPSAHLRVTGLYIEICNSGELDVSALRNSTADVADASQAAATILVPQPGAQGTWMSCSQLAKNFGACPFSSEIIARLNQLTSSGYFGDAPPAGVCGENYLTGTQNGLFTAPRVVSSTWNSLGIVVVVIRRGPPPPDLTATMSLISGRWLATDLASGSGPSASIYADKPNC